MKKACILLVILLLISCCACAKTPVYEKSGFAMGSFVQVRIYGSEKAAETANNVLASINETDAMLSANLENSEIYKLNESATGTTVSEEVFDILGDCLSVCNTTGRVLDITVGAVSELWGFDTDTPALPEEAQLHEAVQTVGMHKLLLDENLLTVAKEQGQKIDLGAFGKGIACMRALNALRSEFAPAVLSVGGTVLLYGNNPDADCWNVGIRNPDGSPDDYCATLALSVEERDDSLVVSTSGNYEKTFEQDAKTYHHILDTATGMPVENDIVGVTVVAHGGLVSDALSTVLFIHGLSEQTLFVLDSYNAEAVFLCSDGRVLVSDGLADKITLTDSARTLGDLEDTIRANQ